jgi:hypothetical protein
MNKTSLGRLSNSLYWKAHRSVVAQQCSCFTMAATWLHSGRGHANLYLRTGLLLYCLTGLHATNRIIACFLICNRNLAYDEVTRLDCCDVISVTSELGMVIITLGGLYFVLSYRVAPTDVASMQHPALLS